MNTEWQQIVALFLLPPGGLVSIGLLGFLIFSKWRTAGSIVIASSLTLLFALSIPLTSLQLTAAVEAYTEPLYPDAVGEASKHAQAIVILGGGRYAHAPEYGSDTVNWRTLVRLRYGARLHRQTGLPMLVSGGSMHGEEIPEAALMQSVLIDDYKIAPRWQESRSRNTLENALFSKALLQAASVKHVILVTHALHMRRAVWAFEQVELTVTAAPTEFRTLAKGDRGIHGYLPSASGLFWSSAALRERMAYRWYRMTVKPQQLVGEPMPPPKK
ncbi:MAG: YdcF family protein [Acidiferrobacterales bacterium]